MILKEEKMYLFNADSKYYFAHCISSDYELGKGIACQFEKKFNLKEKLDLINVRVYPDCILIDKVFNLVTKKNYWSKPSYNCLHQALKKMKYMALQNDVKFIAMPRIGCGLDRLEWSYVQESIELIFMDTDIEILVCYR